MRDAYAYLTGEAETEGQAIAGLQDLINTGQAWLLEGSVGRAAMAAIESGLCVLGREGHRDYWGNYVPSRSQVKPGTLGSVLYAHKLTCGDGHPFLALHRGPNGRFAQCPFVDA